MNLYEPIHRLLIKNCKFYYRVQSKKNIWTNLTASNWRWQLLLSTYFPHKKLWTLCLRAFVLNEKKRLLTAMKRSIFSCASKRYIVYSLKKLNYKSYTEFSIKKEWNGIQGYWKYGRMSFYVKVNMFLQNLKLGFWIICKRKLLSWLFCFLVVMYVLSRKTLMSRDSEIDSHNCILYIIYIISYY